MIISRKSRQAYQFDDSLFSSDGRAILNDYASARRFAGQMAIVRGTPIPASDINAIGLIDEVMHIILRQYEMQNPGVISRAEAWLKSHVGESAFNSTLVRFTDEFPPNDVYHSKTSAKIISKRPSRANPTARR